MSNQKEFRVAQNVWPDFEWNVLDMWESVIPGIDTGEMYPLVDQCPSVANIQTTHPPIFGSPVWHPYAAVPSLLPNETGLKLNYDLTSAASHEMITELQMVPTRRDCEAVNQHRVPAEIIQVTKKRCIHVTIVLTAGLGEISVPGCRVKTNTDDSEL